MQKYDKSEAMKMALCGHWEKLPGNLGHGQLLAYT